MAVTADYELGHDYKHWQDDGCDVSSSCLSCPLAVCKFDLPDDRTQEQQQARLALYNRIMELRAAGWIYEDIARELHVSRRAVSEACRTLPAVSSEQIPLFGELN